MTQDMGIGQNIQMRQKQRQKQIPCVMHGMQLMSLPYAAMIPFLQKIVLENPLLEIQPDEEGIFTTQELISDGVDSSWDGHVENLKGNSQMESAEEILKLELFVKKCPERLKRAAVSILEELDEYGYWYGKLNDIASRNGISPSEAEEALHIIQALGPAGIGARSLPECLILQLDRNWNYYEPAVGMISGDLTALSKKQFSYLQKKYGIAKKDILCILKQLQELQPYPVTIARKRHPDYFIKPEMSVHFRGGVLDIRLCRRSERLVVMNQEAVEYFETSQLDSDAGLFLKRCRKEAAELMYSLRVRDQTLTAVLQAVAEYQKSFFINGMSCLEPMNMQQIADLAAVNISTVSRCVQDKYLETDFGVVPLKSLFTSKIRMDDGSFISSAAVREAIRQILSEEGDGRHYSDRQLTEILAAQKIQISRRTVAKYRKMETEGPNKLTS